MPAEAAGAVQLQFPDAPYQRDTALCGMWLFLASETLFFGALFLCLLYCQHLHPQAWHQATHRTNLLIGTANTILLLTSSATLAAAVAFARDTAGRAAARASTLTALLGIGFVVLKAVEWIKDIHDHDLPGLAFAAAGADRGGEQLFWLLYWTATGLHAVHLLVGIALCLWIARRLRHSMLTARDLATTELVGLYWSFVDMVWLVLYPLLYLATRA